MRIYLDHCAYNRPFDDQRGIKIQLETTAKLYIQDAIRRGKYDLVWSYMSDIENSVNPNIESRNSIQAWELMAKIRCSSSETILHLSREIMKQNVRTKDALHIACAIESGCDYFITTDSGIINKTIYGITIINPIDFVRITGEMDYD